MQRILGFRTEITGPKVPAAYTVNGQMRSQGRYVGLKSKDSLALFGKNATQEDRDAHFGTTVFLLLISS